MSFNQISAIALQKIVKQLLNLDIEAHKQLTAFNGKVIHVQVTDLGLDYYLSFIDSQLVINHQLNEVLFNSQNNEPTSYPLSSVASSSTLPISASISGNLNAFIAAAAAEHSADSIFTGELHFAGEINTAKQFQNFAQSLNIDWQEPFAQIFGDPIAHTVVSSIQTLTGWFLNTANSVKQDVSDYLQEEARATPSQREQNHFFQQVDQLRSQTDRLTARVNQLSSRQTESKESI